MEIRNMKDLSPEIIELIQSEYMKRVIQKLYYPKESGVYVTKLSKKGLLAQIAMLEIIYDDRTELMRRLKEIKFATICNVNGIAKMALEAAGITPSQILPEKITYYHDGSYLASESQEESENNQNKIFEEYLPDEFSYQNQPEMIIYKSNVQNTMLSKLEGMCGEFERVKGRPTLNTPFVKIHTANKMRK